jgi:hypothetical protein
MIAAPTLSAAEKHPRQVKLLGATVAGLGTVVAVTTHLHCGFAIVRDASNAEHRLYFRDIKTLDGLTLAPSVPEYITHADRVGYGTWLELHEVVGQTTCRGAPAPLIEVAA